MAIVETCRHCGHDATAPEEFAGREVPCPGCGESIHLPAPSSLDAEELMSATVELTPGAASPSASNSRDVATPGVEHDKLLVRCDKCFQRYLIPSTEIDQPFDCPKCQNRFRVPREALETKTRAEVAAASGLSESVVAEAAPESPTLGAEMLVEVGLIDGQGSEGAPLRKQRDAFAWVPSGVRACGARVKTFVQDHILGLTLIVISVTVWFIAMVYALR